MAYTTNNDKMLEAVLMNPDLMKFGQYTAADITNIYQAIESENCVISAVAQIIKRSSEDANADVIYKEVTKYLKENV
jgi:hypothetical protein